MSVAAFHLTVPGEPRGQKRARHGRGFTYTDDAQEAYAATIHGEWIAKGRPTLMPGPYRVSVVAWMKRPAAHFRADGSLSKAGLASPVPTKRPDVDNFLKQIDALVAVGAVPDDALMVRADVAKHWARTRPCLEVLVTSLASELGEVA